MRKNWSSGCAKLRNCLSPWASEFLRPEQFASVGKFADAAVVGSAIVQTIESNPGTEAEAVAEFIKQLSALSRQPSVKTDKGGNVRRVAGAD